MISHRLYKRLVNDNVETRSSQTPKRSTRDILTRLLCCLQLCLPRAIFWPWHCGLHQRNTRPVVLEPQSGVQITSTLRFTLPGDTAACTKHCECYVCQAQDMQGLLSIAWQRKNKV